MLLRPSARPLAALALIVGLLAAASQAQAHAAFVSATPAVNATVPSPKQVVVHLSEELAAKFSGFELMRADGSKIPVATTVPATDAKTLVGVIPDTLPPGTYMVMWHAVAADDGHRSKGDYNFTVR